MNREIPFGFIGRSFVFPLEEKSKKNQNKKATYFFFFACDKKKKIGKKKKPLMDCVFVKARKISKSLKGNRGSVVSYDKYLTRTLPDVDYSDKGEIIAKGICGTDEKTNSFWTKSEERENQTKRKDTARFAKEYIMALPHELPIDEQTKICEEVAEILSKGDRVVSWYHHEPDKTEGSDERNFHCHFLMSEREYKNGIFADTKNRDWNSKKTLSDHKKEIGSVINRHLELFQLPKIKIEIGENDREPTPDKTESQKRAEKAEQKKLQKINKKIELAEVKLNGLRGNEHGIADGFGEQPTSVVEPNPTTSTDNKQSSEFTKSDFGQWQDERIRLRNARELAEKQRRELEENRRRIERQNSKSHKPNSPSYGR